MSGGEFHFTTAITIIPPREVVEIRTALSETACKPKPEQQQPLFSVVLKQNRTDLAHMCASLKKSKLPPPHQQAKQATSQAGAQSAAADPFINFP